MKETGENSKMMKAHNFCVLGSKGSGKTCFFAGLWFLAANGLKNDSLMVNGSDETSKKYLNYIGSAFAEGKKLQGTNVTTEICGSLIYNNLSVDFKSIDFPGELFHDGNPGEEQEELLEKVDQAEFVLLLVDAVDIVDPPRDIAERVKSLSNVIQRILERQDGQQQKLALVITKSDMLGEMNDSTDAKQILLENMPSVYNNCRDFSVPCPVFFLASIGHNADLQTTPEPFGYEKILSWMMDTIKREARAKKFKQILRGIAGVVAFVMLCVAAITWLNTLPPDDWLSKFQNSSATDKHMDEICREYYEFAEKMTVQELEDRYKKLTDIVKIHPSNDRIKTALNDAVQKLDDLMFERAKEDPYLLSVYLKDTRFSRHTLEANELLEKNKKQMIAKEKARIARIFVTDRSSLVEKINACRSYTNFSPAERRECMELCNHLDSMLNHGGQFKIVVIRGSGLKKSIGSRAWVTYSGFSGFKAGEEIRGIEPNWNEPFHVNYTFSKDSEIVVVWEDLDWENEDIAYAREDGIFCLPLLLGKKQCSVYDGKYDFFKSTPVLQISYPGDTWWEEQPNGHVSQLIKKYLSPGTYWTK